MDKYYKFYTLVSSLDPDNVRYVGVTSRTVQERFRGHKYCATHPEKCGLPVHKWMASVYKKGGSIIPTEIEQCIESEWEQKEQDLIASYKKQGYSLLNLDKGGKGVITKEMRGHSSLERSAQAHRKAIIAFDLDGNFVKEYVSITAAAADLGICDNPIAAVAKGISKSAGGYQWVFKDNWDGKPIGKYQPYAEVGKTIYQFTEDGALVQSHKSMKDALTAINKKYSCHESLKTAILNVSEYEGFYWSDSDTLDMANLKPSTKFFAIKDGVTYKYKYQKEISDLIGCSKSFVFNKLKENDEYEYKGVKFGKLN